MIFINRDNNIKRKTNKSKPGSKSSCNPHGFDEKRGENKERKKHNPY
jgi:hypothetical protein